MVEPLFPSLLSLLTALWWPFCRVMAMLTVAPVIGETTVPVTVKVLLSLVLAVILMPTAHSVVPIEPISMHGVVATIEQAVIGALLGLAFPLKM